MERDFSRLPRHITMLFLLMFFCVFAFTSIIRDRAEQAQQQELASILSATSEAPALGTRIKSTGCVISGPFPDPECTPGSVFSEATPKQVCVPGYTKKVRNVSNKLRKQIFAEYGISYPQPTGSYEVDHFIPLAIGGNNDSANLFPEAAAPAPGFREKDVVEIFLQQEVCAGRADLGAAQRQIASNWLTVYNSLTEEQIQAIRLKFRSWSN